jgi:hypothetical protein
MDELKLKNILDSFDLYREEVEHLINTSDFNESQKETLFRLFKQPYYLVSSVYNEIKE